MEHPDLAQFAAVVAAAGAVLLLAGRGRVQVLGGLGAARRGRGACWRSRSPAPASSTRSPRPPARGGRAWPPACVLAGAAALAVRRPAWVPVAVLVAAPLRPPIAFESGGGFPIAIADDGQLGRLLPLYFVLAAAALALAWRVLRARVRARRARCRAWSRYPAAAFIAFACLSLTWADRLAPGGRAAHLLHDAVRAAAGRGGAGAVPRLGAARAGAGRHRRSAWSSPRSGLYQAATRELFFFAPNLAVSNDNSDYFRVTSLFGDPSLYGRHVVLAHGHRCWWCWRCAGSTCAWASRCWRVMWAGLLVLLLAVEHGRADRGDAGDRRRDRRAARAAGGGRGPGRGAAGRRGLRGVDRDPRRLAAAGDERPHPARGGHGARGARGPARGGRASAARRPASRRLAEEEREPSPTANFVSHTTPLTVAAELGAVGLALYVWLLVGGSRAIAGVARLDRGLGLALGASLARAVRARALLQRLPRGPAHLAGAGDRRRPAHLAAPRRRRAPRAPAAEA